VSGAAKLSFLETSRITVLSDERRGAVYVITAVAVAGGTGSAGVACGACRRTAVVISAAAHAICASTIRGNQGGREHNVDY
jgi:hypothetical protein